MIPTVLLYEPPTYSPRDSFLSGEWVVGMIGTTDDWERGGLEEEKSWCGGRLSGVALPFYFIVRGFSKCVCWLFWRALAASSRLVCRVLQLVICWRDVFCVFRATINFVFARFLRRTVIIGASSFQVLGVQFK